MATPRRSRLAAAVRHPVRAGRVVSSWYRNDPERFAVVVSQLLPAGLARRAAPMLDLAPLRRLAPATAALVGLRAGRDGWVATRCAELAETGRVHARVRTAVVLAAAERPREAAALVAGLDGTAEVELARARLDYRAGRIGVAVDRLRTLGQAGVRPGTRLRPLGRAGAGRGARLLARYEGELAALAPVSAATDTPAEHPVAPEPGRILHLVTNALPYVSAGYTLRTHRIATAQRALGLDPHVVTSWGWPALQGFVAAPAAENVDGIEYHRLLPDGPIPAAADARLDRAVAATAALSRLLRPALLHAASDHRNGAVAVAVRQRTGLPVVYEVRGFLEETWLARLGPGAESAAGSQRYELAKARETSVMRAADAVVTLSATMRADILARGVPAERVVLAPNAVDSALLTAQPDGAGFRRAYGIPDGAVVVGSVSTLNSYEGFGALLAAAALLRDAGAAVHVLLVGDGPDRAALRAQAAALGLAGQVTLPGRVPHSRALAAHAALDIFVVPRTDARVTRLVSPLKPVEAMALGRPVVASRLPALAELIGDSAAGTAAGLLVPPDDPAALAKALAELRDDPALRRQLGAAGRDAVAAGRTWERIAETYLELYGRLGALGSPA
ncbi:MAG TPA: glycosyltransferase [Actinomycetes bacterium]|nr:glycosyltransferase [Actinomycetes bacterium]